MMKGRRRRRRPSTLRALRVISLAITLLLLSSMIATTRVEAKRKKRSSSSSSSNSRQPLPSSTADGRTMNPPTGTTPATNKAEDGDASAAAATTRTKRRRRRDEPSKPSTLPIVDSGQPKRVLKPPLNVHNDRVVDDCDADSASENQHSSCDSASQTVEFQQREIDETRVRDSTNRASDHETNRPAVARAPATIADDGEHRVESDGDIGGNSPLADCLLGARVISEVGGDGCFDESCAGRGDGEGALSPLSQQTTTTADTVLDDGGEGERQPLSTTIAATTFPPTISTATISTTTATNMAGVDIKSFEGPRMTAAGTQQQQTATAIFAADDHETAAAAAPIAEASDASSRSSCKATLVGSPPQEKGVGSAHCDCNEGDAEGGCLAKENFKLSQEDSYASVGGDVEWPNIRQGKERKAGVAGDDAKNKGTDSLGLPVLEEKSAALCAMVECVPSSVETREVSSDDRENGEANKEKTIFSPYTDEVEDDRNKDEDKEGDVLAYLLSDIESVKGIVGSSTVGRGWPTVQSSGDSFVKTTAAGINGNTPVSVTTHRLKEEGKEIGEQGGVSSTFCQKGGMVCEGERHMAAPSGQTASIHKRQPKSESEVTGDSVGGTQGVTAVSGHAVESSSSNAKESPAKADKRISVPEAIPPTSDAPMQERVRGPLVKGVGQSTTTATVRDAKNDGTPSSTKGVDDVDGGPMPARVSGGDGGVGRAEETARRGHVDGARGSAYVRTSGGGGGVDGRGDRGAKRRQLSWAKESLKELVDNKVRLSSWPWKSSTLCVLLLGLVCLISYAQGKFGRLFPFMSCGGDLRESWAIDLDSAIASARSKAEGFCTGRTSGAASGHYTGDHPGMPDLISEDDEPLPGLKEGDKYIGGGRQPGWVGVGNNGDRFGRDSKEIGDTAGLLRGTRLKSFDDLVFDSVLGVVPSGVLQAWANDSPATKRGTARLVNDAAVPVVSGGKTGFRSCCNSNRSCGDSALEAVVSCCSSPREGVFSEGTEETDGLFEEAGATTTFGDRNRKRGPLPPVRYTPEWHAWLAIRHSQEKDAARVSTVSVSAGEKSENWQTTAIVNNINVNSSGSIDSFGSSVRKKDIPPVNVAPASQESASKAPATISFQFIDDAERTIGAIVGKNSNSSSENAGVGGSGIGGDARRLGEKSLEDDRLSSASPPSPPPPLPPMASYRVA